MPTPSSLLRRPPNSFAALAAPSLAEIGDDHAAACLHVTLGDSITDAARGIPPIFSGRRWAGTALPPMCTRDTGLHLYPFGLALSCGVTVNTSVANRMECRTSPCHLCVASGG